MTATNYNPAMMKETAAGAKMDSITTIEFLTAAELAAKLKVKVSWVVDQTKPSRTRDPLPTCRLGKHVRYAWGSKALNAWLARRFS